MILPIVLFALRCMSLNGVQIALYTELSHAGMEGRCTSFGMMVVQPCIIVGPWHFGLATDAGGSFRDSWLLMATGLLIGGMALGLVRDRQSLIPASVMGCLG